MAFGTLGQLWWNAIIPYKIDEDEFPLGSADRQEIEKAIAEWNEKTVIHLVEWVNEPNHIVFKDVGKKCQSGVGQEGGPQQITCDLDGSFDAGSVIHEIGHAVGLFHEHQRPDGQEFVEINSTSDATNCGPKSLGNILTDYDCNSIMHYGPFTPLCGTITPKISSCNKIGQRNGLSARDVWGTSILYNVPIRSVVVWEDDSDDNGFSQIHASAFSEFGKKCIHSLTINAQAANQQRAPEVGMAGNGNMVFVWEDDTDGNGNYQIKMRGFGNGRQTIPQKTVNQIASGQQFAPHVAVANDGHFVVVWEDDADGNKTYQIKMRIYNADGSPRTSQKTVNVIAQGQQTAPRVAIAANGFFVVVWEDDNNQDGKKDIYMRAFNSSNGDQVWPFQPVSLNTGGNKRRPQIAMASNGNFVVAWEDDTDFNKSYQIKMRGFQPNGTELFSERTVNKVAAGQQLRPDVAVDALCRPVVVWADDQDKNKVYQIKMRGFDQTGQVRIAEQTVNTVSKGQQLYPRIGMEGNGNFTVAWEDDQDKDGKSNILVRGFNSVGNEIYVKSKEVSSLSGGDKRVPSVATPTMA